MPLSGIRVFVIMSMDETDQQRDQEQEAAGCHSHICVAADHIDSGEGGGIRIPKHGAEP